MATQAKPTAAQQSAKATRHKVRRVRIVYGEALEVKNYPPRNLKAGDTIAFEPQPAGELELKFDYGSNFRRVPNGAIVGPGQTISGQKPTVEVIRTMQQPPELDDLKAKAKKDRWLPAKINDLTLNAFPFECKLTIGYGGGAETYTGGFPRPPRK